MSRQGYNFPLAVLISTSTLQPGNDRICRKQERWVDRGRREERVGDWRVGSPRLVRNPPAGSVTLWRHTVDHHLQIITVVVTGHSGTISPSCTLPPQTHQGAFWEKMEKK